VQAKARKWQWKKIFLPIYGVTLHQVVLLNLSKFYWNTITLNINKERVATNNMFKYKSIGLLDHISTQKGISLWFNKVILVVKWILILSSNLIARKDMGHLVFPRYMACNNLAFIVRQVPYHITWSVISFTKHLNHSELLWIESLITTFPFLNNF